MGFYLLWRGGVQGEREMADEELLSAASYLGLHCLRKPVCLNTYGKYVIYYVELLT